MRSSRTSVPYMIGDDELDLNDSRVFVVLHGAIGDVVRALPLVARLKKAWPRMYLAWGVEPRSHGILVGHPFIDELIVFQRGQKSQACSGICAFADYVRRVRQGRFDIAIDLQRHLKSGVVSWLSGAKCRVGFHPRSSRECNWIFNNEYIEKTEKLSPKIYQYQLFGNILGAPSYEPLEFGLVASPDEVEKVNSALSRAWALSGRGRPLPSRENRIVIFPGSSCPSRFWVPERYAILAKRMYHELNSICVFVGGPSESDYIKAVTQHLSDIPYMDLCSGTSLRDLIAVFGCVSLGVGADCGPMHIAAACGLPIVSLWGATSPGRSAPYGSESRVLVGDVACSPCFKKVCPMAEHLCMIEVTVDRVFSAIRDSRV